MEMLPSAFVAVLFLGALQLAGIFKKAQIYIFFCGKHKLSNEKFVDGIRCFECRSDVTRDCGDPFNPQVRTNILITNISQKMNK